MTKPPSDLPTIPPMEISTIRESLRQLRPFAQETGALFFLRLCELDPAMRTRLPDTLGEQSARVFSILEEIAGCLDTPDRLHAVALRLAAANRRLDLSVTQHNAMRLALLWALERSSVGGFPPATREVWNRVFLRLHALVTGADLNTAAA